MKNTSRILIVGGGITGLTLAALLEKKGIVPDIVEREKDWKKEGYGITLFPVGIEVLRKLELVTRLREQSAQLDTLKIATPHGTLIRQFHVHSAGVDSITLDRADLHKALRSRVTKAKVRFSTSIKVLVHKEETVEVVFTDGTKKEYDLVIGSDGVHSVTRRLLFPEAKLHYSGAAVWTFFVPKTIKIEDPQEVHEVWESREFMGIFPGKEHASVTFSAPLDPTTDLRHFDLDAYFDNVGILSHEILRKIKNKDMFAGFLDEMKLGEWSEGRVVLAGDAAHAMMPATGMGASMGMRDAYVITELIERLPIEEWYELGKKYQHVRKHVVDRVQRDAATLGHMFLWSSPLKDARNEIMKWIPQFVITNSMKEGVKK